MQNIKAKAKMNPNSPKMLRKIKLVEVSNFWGKEDLLTGSDDLLLMMTEKKKNFFIFYGGSDNKLYTEMGRTMEQMKTDGKM